MATKMVAAWSAEAGVGFANQVGLKTELNDTKFSYQLITTITLSEDNSPFYDFASNFVFLRLG